MQYIIVVKVLLHKVKGTSSQGENIDTARNTKNLYRYCASPTINSGRPIIEGTRVFVDRIIGHLENGMSIAEICYDYDLAPEQVKAVKQLSPEHVQYKGLRWRTRKCCEVSNLYFTINKEDRI